MPLDNHKRNDQYECELCHKEVDRLRFDRPTRKYLCRECRWEEIQLRRAITKRQEKIYI